MMYIIMFSLPVFFCFCFVCFPFVCTVGIFCVYCALHTDLLISFVHAVASTISSLSVKNMSIYHRDSY